MDNEVAWMKVLGRKLHETATWKIVAWTGRITRLLQGKFSIGVGRRLVELNRFQKLPLKEITM